MIPVELKERLIPPPGRLFVERIERVMHSGRIYIPDQVRATTKAAAAKIVRLSPEVTDPRLAVGAVVLLSPGVSREIKLGQREEVVLTIVYPTSILAIVNLEPESVARVEESPFSHFDRGEMAVLEDAARAPKIDEGVGEALR